MNEYRRIMKIIIKRRKILKRTVIIGSSRENGKFAFPSEEIFSKYLFLNKTAFLFFIFQQRCLLPITYILLVTIFI